MALKIISEACPTQIRILLDTQGKHDGKNLSDANNVYFLAEKPYQNQNQWLTKNKSWSIWRCDLQQGKGWCIGTSSYHRYIYSKRTEASCPTNNLDWQYGQNHHDLEEITVQKGNYLLSHVYSI